LETLRHLTKIKQDTLLAPPTLGRSIVLNGLKKKKKKKKKKYEKKEEKSKGRGKLTIY